MERAGLKEMDDAAFTEVEAAVAGERARRNRVASTASGGTIEAEMRGLKARWDAEAQERLAREQAALAEKLDTRRTKLLDGSWKPWHICDLCILSILEKNPDGRCGPARSGLVPRSAAPWE